MPLAAIVSGTLLIITGIVGYVLGGYESVTALIPAFVGILILLPGIIALVAPGSRKHMMHIAAGVGLLGAILAGGRLGSVLATGGGSTLGRASLAAMAVVCVVFLILCVQSFRAARRNRTTDA